MAGKLRGVTDNLTVNEVTNEQLHHILEAVGCELAAEGEEPAPKELRSSWLIQQSSGLTEIFKRETEEEDRTRRYLWEQVEEQVEILKKERSALEAMCCLGPRFGGSC